MYMQALKPLPISPLKSLYGLHSLHNTQGLISWRSNQRQQTHCYRLLSLHRLLIHQRGNRQWQPRSEVVHPPCRTSMAKGKWHQHSRVQYLVLFLIRDLFYTFSVGPESPFVLCKENSNHSKTPLNIRAAYHSLSSFWIVRPPDPWLEIQWRQPCRGGPKPYTITLFAPIQPHLTPGSGEVVVDEMTCTIIMYRITELGLSFCQRVRKVVLSLSTFASSYQH